MGRAGTMRTMAEMYFLFYRAETILDLYTYIYIFTQPYSSLQLHGTKGFYQPQQ